MNIPVTEWFPAEVKPSIIGEYEYQYEHGYKFRAYFDGERFLIHDKKEPWFWGHNVSMEKGEHWRGLTSPHPEWKP